MRSDPSGMDPPRPEDYEWYEIPQFIMDFLGSMWEADRNFSAQAQEDLNCLDEAWGISEKGDFVVNGVSLALMTGKGSGFPNMGKPLPTGSQRSFAPGKWLDHFQKHFAEFGYKNSVEYLRGAQRVTGGGPGILTHVRKTGDTAFYNPATNEYAVLARNGRTIRTYFKPADKYSYWQEELKR